MELLEILFIMPSSIPLKVFQLLLNILCDLLIFKCYTVIGVVCYGKRLNCFSSSSEECDAIVKANIDFLKALGETFHSPPWWKLWKTQAYKTIETTQDHMMA